jgi:alpha-ketoglutarate-dependent taurine dioxygenase
LQSVHPLVWEHPDTGEKAIMAHTLIMESLRKADGTELDWEASEATLAMMLEHATQPEQIYRHNWQPGDLVVWCAHIDHTTRHTHHRSVAVSLCLALLSLTLAHSPAS